ncbi:hypothetical protein H4R34_003935 [Dimargaris verticillata]|uniref:Secreted protein n=1 Tax=Dimargaris verticillata TaxID=2761393 RepID=A0A9W8EC57_9FUNG|nr:hypothetical protein H4R34_003935 [Dimargaris verticillata]
MKPCVFLGQWMTVAVVAALAAGTGTGVHGRPLSCTPGELYCTRSVNGASDETAQLITRDQGLSLAAGPEVPLSSPGLIPVDFDSNKIALGWVLGEVQPPTIVPGHDMVAVLEQGGAVQLWDYVIEHFQPGQLGHLGSSVAPDHLALAIRIKTYIEGLNRASSTAPDRYAYITNDNDLTLTILFARWLHEDAERHSVEEAEFWANDFQLVVNISVILSVIKAREITQHLTDLQAEGLDQAVLADRVHEYLSPLLHQANTEAIRTAVGALTEAMQHGHHALARAVLRFLTTVKQSQVRRLQLTVDAKMAEFLGEIQQ